MASYEDDGYSFSGPPRDANGGSFGTQAMGKAGAFTFPILSSLATTVRDGGEAVQIIVSGSPILNGSINVVMVLVLVYCTMALFFPRQLRAVLRALLTSA